MFLPGSRRDPGRRQLPRPGGHLHPRDPWPRRTAAANTLGCAGGSRGRGCSSGGLACYAWKIAVTRQRSRWPRAAAVFRVVCRPAPAGGQRGRCPAPMASARISSSIWPSSVDGSLSVALKIGEMSGSRDTSRLVGAGHPRTPVDVRVLAAVASGPALSKDGRDRQPEPPLGPMWQVGPQPARDGPGQRGHDDLVEPVIGEHLRPAANRENMTTATNPTARWLFPGQRAGQPLNAGTLWEELRQLGFSTAITRPSALRQLVPQAPAPVVARSLGFHDQTTTALRRGGRNLETLRPW